jgi:hypothetical protein
MPVTRYPRLFTTSAPLLWRCVAPVPQWLRSSVAMEVQAQTTAAVEEEEEVVVVVLVVVLQHSRLRRHGGTPFPKSYL